MAKKITTESIKSENRVIGSYDVYDFLAILVILMFTYFFRIYVHPSLRAAYIIFSLAISFFLVSKSGLNKKRKNYESVYFFLTKDISVYRPFYIKEKVNEKEKEE
ncbi:DUF5592 family protein [Anaerofustis stercorihominis]|uniref:DUF5592 family protein n=1 Tax=Anaerofustis stercorihominis TaxID=214853 RepID=UPI003983F1FC